MTRRWVIGLVSLVVAVALAGLGYVAYRSLRPGVQSASVAVVIDAPALDDVVTVAQPTTVHVVASGPGGVTRVELWADGVFVTAAESAVPAGGSPLPLLTSWLPTQPGPHSLVARALDRAGAASTTSLDVQVVAPDSDRDADGVADPSDACPDEAGFGSAGGCPDLDGDARADGADQCPDTAGVAAGGGCPAPSADDGDGDGTSDALDACAAQPGGGSDGCPLRGDPDGDGVPSADDRCPEVAGSVAGCPDADGDAVPDIDDPCRDVVGPVGGCPGPAAEDSDGDGLPDAADECAAQAGPAENRGCPGEAPVVPEEGIGDDPAEAADPCGAEAAADGESCPEPSEERALVPGSGRMLLPASQRVEFQAVSLLVGDGYDGLVCYPSLGGAPVERYEFGSVDGVSWQAPADLASRMLLVLPDEPVGVQMECGADVRYLGAEQPWGTYWSLGGIVAEHDADEWDGRLVTQRSRGGDDGRWFEVQYRLCAGSCVDPVAKAVTLARDGDDLVWSWSAEEGVRVSAYAVYLDGVRIALLRGGADTASMDVSGYEPACGLSRHFTVTAVLDDGTESEPSNTVTWVGDPCPRVVRVTFDHLTTFDLGNDQGSASTAGPIYGAFTATGSTSETLSFNGLDRGDWWGEDDRGFRLSDHSTYPVQEVFDRIGTWIANSMSSPYSAPERTWVTVDLDDGADLTIGGFIGDGDQGSNDDDTLFDGSLTLPADDVRPGRYRVVDRNIALTALVDVVVGPEVAGDPDLAITAVEPGPEGSLSITVFNNAAGMAQASDLVVQWADAVSGEVLDTQTWPDVQLGSGATAVLQTTDPVAQPGGTVYVLDPRGAVPDANPANNTFRTPVPLRVELVGAEGAQCSEARCTILALANCEAEWAFTLWVGTGESPDEVEWLHRMRLPEEGVLIGCDEDHGCTPAGSPPEAWNPDGGVAFTAALEVDPGDALYVRALAREDDVVTADDAFAAPVSEYLPADGWGARAQTYTARLSPEQDCDDVSELVCDECVPGEVTTTWRISRAD